MSSNSVSDLRMRAGQYRAAADLLDTTADKVEQELAGVGGLLEGSLANGHVAPKRAKAAKGTGRGRPKGSKNKPKDGIKVAKAKKDGRGRPKGSKNKPKDGTAVAVVKVAKVKVAKAERKPRENTLSALIHKILKEKKGGVDLPGLTKECLDRGYESDAQDFQNIVYQTANKMSKTKHNVEFNKQDRKYRLAKSA